jgi:predicted RNA-binding protein YlxR (DUF448 family)
MSDVEPQIPPLSKGSESQGPKTLAEASRQRRDLVSGAVMGETRLIRFVAAPDGTVTPDLGRKLPGRGLWVAADRASVEQAARKGGFSRSAKAKLSAAPDLADQVETLLVRQCLDRLGLARRAGALTSGFEKVSALVSSGRAAWLIEASDGSADGRGKILALARHAPKPPQICGAFDADELSLALGLGHAIHTAFPAGRWAERFSEALGRLAGFRPILPERWSEETAE